MIKFSIVIPTYNRAQSLENLLLSIAKQQTEEIEIIIIDDGSTDNTSELVASWKKKSQIPISYWPQKNAGRVRALNVGFKKVSGELTIIMDDDDVFTKDALQELWSSWSAIPKTEKQEYCGITGLVANKSGIIIGSSYPADNFSSDFFSIRFHHKVTGDKKEAISSRLLKNYQFPIFPKEKRCPTSILWYMLAKSYKTLFINKVLVIKNYRKDGLTQNILDVRIKSLFTTIHYYRYLIESFPTASFWVRLKFSINYYRFNKHAKQTRRNHNNHDFNNLPLNIISLGKIFGFFYYFVDKITIKIFN